ncbi:hypothetical protein PSTG_17504 [Puccinia striiformis f. sp. tritici PST-78]|uniref:Thioredoxin domain-containing protein n=1 Tax=Puccinia striiformis f. sp. tritici PST-78 TaxID=1165861 RepID=A0A0L0UPU4_9BASI|nr:hypothetical protein PSTG_17504 [Puccinia striiformis f. sp. tritici PST-78]
MSITPLKTLQEFHAAIGKGSEEECCAIIDFWATWCGPCRVISPQFEKLASEDTSGKLKYYKVDVDEAAVSLQTQTMQLAIPFLCWPRIKAPYNFLVLQSVKDLRDN